MEELVAALRRGAPLSISLGAGGVRSMAGLGVLRALRELHPNIMRFTASSFGALIAASLVFGVPEATLIGTVQTLRVRRLLRPQWRSRGVFSHEPMRRVINSILPDARLEDAPTPLTVWCTDLARGEAVEFSSGSVRDVVLASSVFAGFFNPVTLDDRLYTDGGYTAATPPPRLEAGWHGLVVDVRRPPTLSAGRKRSLLNPARWVDTLQMINASVDTLFGSQKTPEDTTSCTVIQPPLGGMLVGDFSAAHSAIEIAQQMMRDALRPSL